MLGSILREARGNESQRSVAKKAGISVVYYGSLEKGINRKTGKPSIPSPEVTIRLADALNIDPQKLLNHVTSSAFVGLSTTPEGIAQLALEKFRSLARNRREMAAELVKRGFINENNTSLMFKQLKVANVYDKAATLIETTLSNLESELKDLL